jgi:hypothetical protein
MRTLGAGDARAAWEDLQSAHRLIALLAGDTRVVFVIVAAMQQFATLGADMEILQHGNPDRKLLEAMLTDLQNQPPLPSAVTLLGREARFEGPDGIQNCMRDWNNSITEATPSVSQSKAAALLTALDLPAGLDWNRAMRDYNEYWDTLFAEPTPDTFTERRARALSYERTVETMHNESGMFDADWHAHFAPHTGESKQEVAERLAKCIFSLTAPNFLGIQDAIDKSEMKKSLTLTAIALELYRLDHATYPADLAALTPQYLPKIPQDFYNRPLTYQHTDTSFRLASTGPINDDLATAEKRREAIIVELHH